MKKSASLYSMMSATTSYGKSNQQIDEQHTEQQSTTTTSRDILQSIDLVLDPPKPSLVTYSTLMSRAVSLGKPRVALRLWNLMRNQPNYYTNVISQKQRDGKRWIFSKRVNPIELQMLEREEGVIVPDVIFCNTLMNAYAKMGEHELARSILNAMLGTKNVKCHEGIPVTNPTVVSYNTLADACKIAGELGAALEVLELMSAHAEVKGDTSINPDARTYTILISTVARKKLNEKERSGGEHDPDMAFYGEHDPDMAFALLNRMMNEGITPNGVTYCALIDVCSRCGRCDLALNGLRIMLKQKVATSLASPIRNVPIYHQQNIAYEVGAWTAAINACGKTGRTDTAIRLFKTMQKVGVKPNAVTCGCLSDCLLKATPIRMAETLEVLQYMKREGLAPSPVMYTSLMGIALTLAEKENHSVVRRDGLEVQVVDKFDPSESKDSKPDSIVLYTELMRCLILDKNDKAGNDDILLQVFLVYQSMRNAGAIPDVACYNSLLRACVLSGDIEKTQDVLQRMTADEIEPHYNTLRGTLKAARKAKRSDIADAIWNAIVTYKKKDTPPLIPNISDVELLMSVYQNELRSTSSHEKRSVLNKKIMSLYVGIVNRSEERGLQHIRVDEIEENQDFMIAVLRAAVSHEFHSHNNEEKAHAKELACDIAGLEVFQYKLPQHYDRSSKKALTLAQDWLYSY